MKIDKVNVIEMTRDLVKLKSINPGGDERDVTKYLQAVFEREGIKYWFQDVEPNRRNIIAFLEGESREGIIFTGHQDVVPISEEEAGRWEREPFSGEIIDGFIYGRGSSDMKGGLSAAVCALINIKRGKITPKRDIYLVATVDEEHYMKGSTMAILDTDIQKAKYVVVCEPTDMTICTASKGRTWAKVTVHGKTAHGSQRGAGVNAIEKCSDLIQEIKKETFIEKANEVGQSFWQAYAISAGVEPAIVPDKCEVFIDARLTLGHEPREVWSKLDIIIDRLQKVDKDFVASYEIVEKRSPWITSVDDDLVVLAKECAKKEGIDAKTALFAGTTDGTKFHSIGITPIIFGPGNLACVHKENERLNLSELILATKIYTRMMIN